MEKYIHKKDIKLHKVEEALLLDMKKIQLHYKAYINPQLVNLLNLLGLSKNFVKAQDTKVWDEEGEEYIDFLGAYGALNVGHNNQYVIDKINKIQHLPNLLQTAANPLTSILAKNLETITPDKLRYTFFCNSGTEAVEGALKLAKIATGKPRIVYCRGSFHGKSMGALSVTGREKYKKYFQPLVPLCEEVPYGDLYALKETLSKYSDVAAFIVEPIQGEGGIIVPPKGYLKDAERICKKYNVLLIADEVQTGFGRTGHWFACDEENVTPDILCMAKSLGGGVIPTGAYITTEEIWNKSYGSIEKCLLHTSTFGGNTWASAAGLATIQYIYDNSLAEEAKEKGEHLMERLQYLKETSPLLKDVRGKGLMIGLEFHTIKENRFFNKLVKSKTGEVIQEYIGGLIATELLNHHKIITAYTLNNPNVIRIEPPLTITNEEIDYFVKSLDSILNKYKGVTELVINNFRNRVQSIIRR